MPGNDALELFGEPGDTRVMARRGDILAEVLDFDRHRLLEWSLAQAILSAWWSIEDHDTWWEHVVHCAELIDRLLSWDERGDAT